MSAPFRVGITRDFLGPAGDIGYGEIGLGLLDAAGLQRNVLSHNPPELDASLVRGFDGLLVLAPRVTSTTLEGADRLLIVARFGVGYDNVDVEACTRAGVALTITPDGVRRPVAVAAMTLLLALTHKLLIKDRLTRTGRWHDRLGHMGVGVTGRTLGIIGLGNIGRDLAALATAFDLRVVAHDPFLSPGHAVAIEMLPLDALMTRSDFVCICCALTPQTKHMIDAAMLSRMKPTAYLINVARGPIVDQAALTEALATGRIAGAGLDVFEQEPIGSEDPILTLDNVIVAPHSLCWTDECFRGIGESACRSIVDISRGQFPNHVVNREVLDSPAFLEKLHRHGSGTTV